MSLWLASGEEEATAGGHGEDNDDQGEEKVAAGGRGENNDGRWEEAAGTSGFGATAVSETDDSSREAREEGNVGG
ncbi:hypothetical protein B296_00030618 [Ensete ventricosum]|uniref:Uncharacterized protein n=1 Tax=Ensete ventricosum TaxID=4639 RepID=A0A426ZMY6_ENSVE|nr:hypothetical protein B296_00030618 [Ensete ventricosum]